MDFLKAGCIEDLLAEFILLFRGKLLEQGQEMVCPLGKSFAELAKQHPAGTFLQASFFAFLFRRS